MGLPAASSASAHAGPPPAVLERTRNNRLYVRHVWIFLGSIILFFTLVNFSRRLLSALNRRRQRASSRSTHLVESEKKDAEHAASARPTDDHRPSIPSRLVASAATAFRIVTFRWSLFIGPYNLGSLGELAFILSYIAANLIWLFMIPQGLNIESWKARSAMIATGQIPLVVALGTKNNIISWLTGVSHEKLNVLHRASARTVFIFLWIHVVGRSVTGLPRFGPGHWVTLDQPFMLAGVIGMVALTSGVFLSLPIFRHGSFEFFFLAHVTLMFVFVVTAYLHVRQLKYEYYAWPAFIVWGLDRVLRFGALLWNNLWRCSSENKAQATVELITPNTVRLSMKRKFSWKAGQHAYICLPQLSRIPTEFHPFTISTIPENLDGTKPEEKEIVFLIKAHDGLTNRLMRHASQNGSCTVTAYVDGPYGSPPDLHHYSTSILVAGGSGISYTLPLLFDLIRRSSTGESSDATRIKFVWIVRGEGHLPWINKILAEVLPKAKHPLVVDACIYVTGSAGAQETQRANFLSNDEKEIGYIEPEPTDSSIAQIFHGRPDLQRLLDEEISGACGPVAVDIAGPATLTTSVKAAVSAGAGSPGSVLQGRHPVTLHVETFGMA
ncbi:ferric reductase NAD binding domain-containing protein [Coprinopsis sp. MPI-PUGE-AT-0042]|nr:ferric reductase NAD binding domain-containing protein [Coprinopsis sp. MPI-PUGE-AT-0042]